MLPQQQQQPWKFHQTQCHFRETQISNINSKLLIIFGKCNWFIIPYEIDHCTNAKTAWAMSIFEENNRHWMRSLLKSKFPSLSFCNLMNDCWFLEMRVYIVHVVRFIFHSKCYPLLSWFGSNRQNSTVWITTFLSLAKSLIKNLSWQITKPICCYLRNALYFFFFKYFGCACFGSVYSLHAYHQIERWKFEYFTIFLA